MLGARGAMKSDTFKRTVCPNGSSKILGEGPKGTLTTIITIAEEAAAGTQGIKDEVR